MLVRAWRAWLRMAVWRPSQGESVRAERRRVCLPRTCARLVSSAPCRCWGLTTVPLSPPPHLGVSPEGLGTSHPWTALRESLHTRVKSCPVHTSLQTLLSRVGKGVMLTQCVCMSHVPCCTAVALGRTAVAWPDDRATRHQRQASGPLLVPLVTIAVLRESVS